MAKSFCLQVLNMYWLLSMTKFDIHPCHASSRSGHYAIMEWLKAHGVNNVEDRENVPITENMFNERHRPILVVRDPFNNFASWIKVIRVCAPQQAKWMEKISQPEFLVELSNKVRIWKTIACEFCGKTNYLRGQAIFVNYNEWHTDVDYRRHLIQGLGLEFTDKERRSLPLAGWNSSFDGRSFHGKAEKMQTLNRWQSMYQDPLFKHMIQDEEVIELSRKIFNFCPQEVLDELAT